jgi:hypothetical protein
MFLGFKVRAVGDEDFTVGLRAQGLGGAESTGELPTPASIISLFSAWMSRPTDSSIWDGSKSSGR